MNKRLDYQLLWKGFHGCDARCRIQLFDDIIFKGRTIAIITELEDNPGTSVTNDIETIAATICDWIFSNRSVTPDRVPTVADVFEPIQLNPANVTFIEHYPERSYRDGRRAFAETFDVVTFGGAKNQIFKRPEWSRIDWETLRPFISETEGVSWFEL